MDEMGKDRKLVGARKAAACDLVMGDGLQESAESSRIMYIWSSFRCPIDTIQC